MELPKVKVGFQTNKKTKLNLSHDSNFTTQFGRVGCATLIECLPKSKTVVRVNSLVRMAPLVVPTTTRLRYELFSRFVPFADLYEPYENLYSGQSYGTAQTTYTPSSVPIITLKDLCTLLFRYSWMTVYKNGVDLEVGNAEIASSYASARNISTTNNLLPNTSNIPFTTTIGGVDYNVITPDNADFVFKYQNYHFCIKLNNNGKAIRSILLGLGYNLDPMCATSLSALPIFAFCKAYFDTFYPQQGITWTDTDVYRLLDRIRVFNHPNFFRNDLDLTIQAFDFLSGCYYTDNHDFVSAHISSPAKAPAVQKSFSKAGALDSGAITVSANEKPSNFVNSITPNFTADSLRTLLKLNTLQNIATNIGGKIGEFLKAFTGSDELHNKDSYFIGHSTVVVGVEDINNMTGSADSDSYYLGEYAGKGIGKTNDPKTLSYENEQIGYWIVMFAVVPESNYFQGNAPHLYHRSRMEQYFAPFDGLGYEITPKSMIYSANDVVENSPDESFGFIPQYTSFKVHNNVVSGDISLRSTRTSMMPYTIDKFITPRDVVHGAPTGADGHITFPNLGLTSLYIPLASPEWRYINKYPWLANYDRIFPNGVLAPASMSVYQANNNLTDDPFFCFNYIEVTQYAHVKPISESFDTDGEGDSMEVQKQ